MYSYQHITNRNEFIQKFREDQGLVRNSRQNTQGPESGNKVKSRIAMKPGTVNNTYIHTHGNMSNNNSRLNTSTGKIPNNHNEGRWDYLHKLEKLKRMKLDHLRKKKEDELFEQDLQHCTFSPKLNTNKSTGNLLRGRSKNQGGLNDLNALGNNLGSYEYGISTPKSVHSNNQGVSETGGTIADRHKHWAYKRDIKIEKIKQTQNVVENKECVFTPKLNSPDKLSRIDIGSKTKNLIVDPESYDAYVKRLQAHRSTKELLHKREKSLPGSGNIWTNKVTKPQEFQLATDSSHSLNVNKSLSIKSLTKPVALNKFTNVKSNYKVGDGRMERKNILKTEDLIYSQRDKQGYDELEQKSQHSFKFNNDKIEFNYAIQSLHDQLHSINLRGYD